jgi:hypothetical protein
MHNGRIQTCAHPALTVLRHRKEYNQHSIAVCKFNCSLQKDSAITSLDSKRCTNYGTSRLRGRNSASHSEATGCKCQRADRPSSLTVYWSPSYLPDKCRDTLQTRPGTFSQDVVPYRCVICNRNQEVCPNTATFYLLYTTTCFDLFQVILRFTVCI